MRFSPKDSFLSIGKKKVLFFIFFIYSSDLYDLQIKYYEP